MSVRVGAFCPCVAPVANCETVGTGPRCPTSGREDKWRKFVGNMQVSVARYLRTPPDLARGQDLISACRTAYAARATGARLSFAIVQFEPITVVSHRNKATSLDVRRSYFVPVPPSNEGFLVETPGTAPGSDPLITCAFMSIVPEGTV